MMQRFALGLVGLVLAVLPISGGATDHGAVRDRALVVLETQFGGFRDATGALAAASRRYCAGALDEAAYGHTLGDAWLAWAPLDAYQFGPIVQNGAVLSVGFWPDKKDYVGRGLKALLKAPPDTLHAADTIAAHSAAVQGLPAIERLLFDDLPACPAVIGISALLEASAGRLFSDWFGANGWAALARDAGPENPVYLSEREFTKVLFTAIDFELTRIVDARLGRPLGTYDAPRPTRAEAWRAGLSFDIIKAQVTGIETLLEQGFADAVPAQARTQVRDMIGDVHARIDDIEAPLDVAVADPSQRIRVEGLQSQLLLLRQLIDRVVGPALGVQTGFSAADGD